MLKNFFNLISKKPDIEYKNIAVEKKFKSFSEFKSMSVFIIKLHDLHYGNFSVFLKSCNNIWVWEIEAKNMAHEHFISLYKNLNEMCLNSAENQAVLNAELPQSKVIIFKK